MLNALMRNWDDTLKGVTAATNSAGSAVIENEKALDSIQGKLNNLSSAFQQFSQNTIDSGLIKFLIDLATTIVTVIDRVGLLTTALVGLSTFTKIFPGNKFSLGLKAFLGGIASIPSSLTKMVGLFREGKASGLGFGDSLKYAGVSASLAQVAFTGLMIALTAIKLGIDAYNRGVEEHSRKAKEIAGDWEKTRQTLTDTKNTLSSIEGEFVRLGAGVDAYGNNIALTSSEFDRYNQIANEVARMFPEMVSGYTEQGNAILSTKGNVSDLTEAYKQQEIAARNASAASAGTVFEEFRRQTNTPDKLGKTIPIERERDIVSAIIDILNTSDKRTFSDTDVLKAMGRAGTSKTYSTAAFKKVIASTGLDQFETSSGSSVFRADSIKKNRAFLDSYMQSLVSQMESEANTVKPFVESILFGTDAYKGLTEKQSAFVSRVANTLGYEYYSQFKNAIDASAGLTEDVLFPIVDNQGLNKSIDSIDSVRGAMLRGEASIGEYKKSWDSLVSSMSETGLEDAVIDAILSIYQVRGLDSSVSRVKKLLSDEFDHMVDLMTLDDLRLAESLEIPDGVQISWDDLQTRIRNVRNVLTSLTLTENVASLKEAAETANKAFADSEYHASITKAEYDKLIALGDDYAATVDNTNGYLTVNKQKLDALIESKQNEMRAQIGVNKAQKLAEYERNAYALSASRDALTLHQKALDKTSESYLDNEEKLKSLIKGYETSQDKIRDEIKAYDILASELNYATSAYKRWLDAKKSPEAGDGYDELSVARKAIEEGLESGKVGTNKFKAAEALLIPEEISAQGKKDIDAYMKAIDAYMKDKGKYLTEDGEGLGLFVDDLFGKGFLEKDETGKYLSTQKANIQDIAEELNITEDAARLMFLALRDYGWDINIAERAFDSSEAIARIDALKTSLQEAQDKLEELHRTGASDAEINAQKQVRDNLQAELDDAIADPLQVPAELSLLEQLENQRQAIEKYLLTVDEIDLPAEFKIDVVKQLGIVQGMIDALKETHTLIADAKISGDTRELEKALAGLTPPSEDDPNYSIKVLFYNLLTDEYKAAIAEIKGLTDEENPPETTLHVGSSGVDTVESELTNLARDRTATITVDDTKLSDAEKRLEALQKKFDEHDPEDEMPPLSVLHGESTPEDILDFWEGANQEIKDGAESASKELEDEEVRIFNFGDPSTYSQEIQELGNAATAIWQGTGSAIEESVEDAEVSLAHLGNSTSAIVEDAEVSLAHLGNSTSAVVDDVEVSLAHLGDSTSAVIEESVEDAEVSLAHLGNSTSAVVEDVEVSLAHLGNSTSAVVDDVEVSLAHLGDSTSAVIEESVEDAEVSLEHLGNSTSTVVDDVEVSLAHLGNSTSAVIEETTEAGKISAEKIREAFRMITEGDLEKEVANYETGESWANYLQSLIDKLNRRKEILGELSPGDKGMMDAYQAALDKANEAKEKPLVVDTKDALKAVDDFTRTVDGKVVTIKVVTEHDGSPAYAKGTKRAKKGIALTGEEGVEAVLSKEGFYTVGHGGPELVSLQGGEEILPADETKKLFRRSRKQLSGQAFGPGATGGSFIDRLVSGASDLIGKTVKFVLDAPKAIANGISKLVKDKQDVSATGGDKPKTNKKSTNDNNNGKKKDLVDWIPILLDRLRRHTENIIEQSEALIEYSDQNEKLTEAIESNTKSIDANDEAYERYMTQASEVAQTGRLSADIVTKIQDGIIDIEMYDEGTRKLISDYEKWYKLAQQTRDTVKEIRKEQDALAKQKLTNVQEFYESRAGLYSNNVDLAQSIIALAKATGREVQAMDYDGIFDDLQNQLSILREERKVYEETFADLVSSGVVKKGSKEWFEYTANVNRMDKAIVEASISLDEFNDIVANMPIKNLDIAMKHLNTVQDTLESVQGLREAQGKTLESEDYERLISVGMEQIQTLEAQNKALRDQQSDLDVLSDAYQEIQDKIDDNLSSIWNIKTTQEGWNDAIIDLEISKLQEVNEEYEKQLRTMDAIEALENARQRRNLIYREGQGFVYEADQGEIKRAQREFDDIMFDGVVDAMERRKKDDNVYDSAGNLIGKQFTSLDGVDFKQYLSTVFAGRENSSLLGSAIGQINFDAIKNAGAKTNNVEFTGDIVLNGVNDVHGLADSLKVELPSYIRQLWFSNT